MSIQANAKVQNIYMSSKTFRVKTYCLYPKNKRQNDRVFEEIKRYEEDDWELTAKAQVGNDLTVYMEKINDNV